MAKKIQINNHDFAYPTPVFIVGVNVDNKANFMPASWVTRVNVKPNIMAVSINTNRHSYKGILEHKVFSLNLASTNLVTETDYCAIVSGKKEDKSGVFNSFYGELEQAPMIEESPICAECKVTTTVDLDDHALVVAEVINTYIDEECLTDNKPDINKIKPFVFTMPDNNYWVTGEYLAPAWNIGKKLKKSQS
ncbi:MAG: flavin reductase family protein [Gammaproteobacteria bacterium]|nr:flavin reductase family protein [Gammaproteobacteria bacterium]